MNGGEALLKDIHLPAALPWWALAPGWYILAFLILLILLLMWSYTGRYYAAKRASRQALKLLQYYEADYKRQSNAQMTAAYVSELLKRVALAYYPRKQVAALKGEDWIDFLTHTGNGQNFKTVQIALLEIPYQRTGIPYDLSPLFQLARAWIKLRRHRCLN